MASESDDGGMLGDMLEEDDAFYAAERPVQFIECPVSQLGAPLRLRLLGEHPLWGNYLWNASHVVSACLLGVQPTSTLTSLRLLADCPHEWPEARSLEEYLSDFTRLCCKDKRVVELGSGAGLPSLVAAKGGARFVVATDYPDDDLLENIRQNVKSNLTAEEQQRISVAGHIWGRQIDELLTTASQPQLFDLAILSDLIFNHSAHEDLLRSCDRLLTSGGCALVAFSHHRPHLADRDLKFFSLAAQAPFHFQVRYLCQVRMTPMFDEDPGDPVVRATVHLYMLCRTETPSI